MIDFLPNSWALLKAADVVDKGEEEPWRLLQAEAEVENQQAESEEKEQATADEATSGGVGG
jgi:hypothetical protein